MLPGNVPVGVPFLLSTVPKTQTKRTGCEKTFCKLR